MFIPIAVVVLMSFNQPKSKLIYKFDAFTLQNWLHPCADPSMCHAVVAASRSGCSPRWPRPSSAR